MKSIAIYNNKGGCGKSTSVINLAYEFSANNKVLVIDTDGQSKRGAQHSRISHNHAL